MSYLKIFVTINFLFLTSINIGAYTRIEAESFSSMSGIQFENNNTTIGYIDTEDWILYKNVDFGAGPSSIILSIAKVSSGGYIEMRVDEITGPLISTFYPTNTDSWTLFTEQTCKVVSHITGIRDLYFIAKDANGVCNLDYFILSDTKIYEPNWVLQWSDEFNGTDVDESIWRKVFHGNPDNGEIQFYTPRPENIKVSDGTLKLIAHNETYTGQGPWMSSPATREFTSGKIETQGKKVFKYGRIEARIKIPRGKGTWPAFWLLGKNLFDVGVGWPKCGEIDIMEHGQDFNNLGAAIHTQAYNHTIGTQKTGTYQITDYDTDFHIYGVDWFEDKLSFYVDYNYYFSVTKQQLGSSIAEWPFDQPFWIILNHAVGGAWGGTPETSLYPHVTEIDWVRVYDDIQQTGINEQPIDLKSIKLFPNPAKDILNLEISNAVNIDNEQIRVKISDITGKEVLNTIIQKKGSKLNIMHLNKGIYFLSVFTDDYFSGTSVFIKN